MADIFRIKGWTTLVSGRSESGGQQVSTEQEQNLFFSACPLVPVLIQTTINQGKTKFSTWRFDKNNLLKILELVEHDRLNYYYLVNVLIFLTFVFWSVEVDCLSHVVHCYVYVSLVSCH